jgi:hypothetical protein
VFLWRLGVDHVSHPEGAGREELQAAANCVQMLQNMGVVNLSEIRTSDLLLGVRVLHPPLEFVVTFRVARRHVTVSNSSYQRSESVRQMAVVSKRPKWESF